MAKIDSQKIIGPIMRFVNMRGIIALKDGIVSNFTADSSW